MATVRMVPMTVRRTEILAASSIPGMLAIRS